MAAAGKWRRGVRHRSGGKSVRVKKGILLAVRMVMVEGDKQKRRAFGNETEMEK